MPLQLVFLLALKIIYIVIFKEHKMGISINMSMNNIHA